MSGLTLVPFEAKPACVKCGSTSNTTHYCGKVDLSRPCSFVVRQGYLMPEHLCKDCRVCGYNWYSELWDGSELEDATEE